MSEDSGRGAGYVVLALMFWPVVVAVIYWLATR